jgi:monoterpene epsilon-lactone hydrolase
MTTMNLQSAVRKPTTNARVLASWLAFMSMASVSEAIYSSPNENSGSVAIKPAALPMSEFASEQAQQSLDANLRNGETQHAPSLDDMTAVRRFWGAYNDRLLEVMKRAYPTIQKETTLGGVAAQIVEPVGGVPSHNAKRILINLHGGAFMWGAGSGALVEAIPIAATGHYRVVTIDYRLAPENRYPAASQDVEHVYRELLKGYSPQNIGIYGCSAGGALTAEATAWLINKGLPKPGAIGTFCGTGLPFSGDSVTLGQLAMAQAPMPQNGAEADSFSYLAGVKPGDILAYPGNSPAMLAKFPPTLLLAGGRDFAVSALTTMQRRLLSAGVEAQLILFDGLGHAFFMDPDLPESREVFTTVSQFFDRHLGR